MKNFLKESKGTIITFIIALSIALFLIFNFKGVAVIGDSMKPTFNSGNFLLVKKNQTIKRNAYVLFYPKRSWDKQSNKEYIKRVVAVPGDKVYISNNIIKVNNKVIHSLKSYSYVKVQPKTFTVPKNSYFAMGDNYKISNDSLHQYMMGNSQFLVHKSQIKLTFKKLWNVNKNL